MTRVSPSRSPNEAEVEVCRQVLAKQRELAEAAGAKNPFHAARESLLRIVLNHNDFVTIR